MKRMLTGLWILADAVVDRIAWMLTMLTLAFIGLLSPRLLQHILDGYCAQDMRAWWRDV